MTRPSVAVVVAVAVVSSTVAGAVGPGVVAAASVQKSNFTVTNTGGQQLNISFEAESQIDSFQVFIDKDGATSHSLTNDSFTEISTGSGYRYEATYDTGADGYFEAQYQGSTELKDGAYVDTTGPSVTNVGVADDADGNGLVRNGDAVRVTADVSDATTEVRSVTADASRFGAGTVSLSLSGGTTYTGTFDVGEASPVTVDGDENVTIVATDNRSNENRTHSGTLLVDANAPVYAASAVTDDADGDGSVDAGESVTVEVDVSDATTEVQSVMADLSDFGAGAAEALTNESGSSVYNATVTVTEGGTTDGDYAVSVDATDRAGNLNRTTAGTLTLNTDPNVTAFAVDNSSERSLGVSFDSDESLDDIVVTVSGAQSTTLTRTDFTESGGGPYSYDATYDAPTDGTYTLTLDEANDSTGKNGAGDESETVVVDTAGPTVGSPTLTDGDGDGDVTDGDAITVEATVSDATTGVASVTADLSAFDRGTAVPLTATDGTTWNATTTVGPAPTEGDRSVTVTATDDEGNDASADTGTLGVDTTGPGISSPTLTNGSGGVSVVRDNDTVVVSATVTDATGVASVTTDASAFGVGTQTLANVGGDAYEASFTVDGSAAAGDGNYSLTVEATDDLGIASTATTNELTQDVNPPATSGGSLVGADGDGVVGDGETVTVELTVTDATTVDSVTADATALGGGSVGLSRDGSTDVYDGAFQVNASGVTDGDHAVSVEAVDSQGKSSTTTVGTLTLDTVAPSATGLSLTDGDGDGYLADGESLTVTVSPDGTGSGVRSVDAVLSDFGAGTVSLTDGDSDGTWDATASVDASNAAADGGQTGSVTVTDEAGGTYSDTTGSLTLDTAKPTLSAVTVTDDADGDGVVADGERVTVDVTATDATAGVESVTADLTAFGAGTVTLTDAGGGDWSKTVTVDAGNAGSDGDYAVSADATDRAGNVRTGTSSSLKLDTTGPSVSSPTLADETGDGVLTDGENLSVEATVTDANGVATATVDLSAFGAGTVTLTDGDSDGTWNATAAVDAANAGADGSVSATVRAEDDRGTVGTGTTGSLTLDTDGPAVSGVTFTDATDGDGVVAPGDQIDVSADVTDPAGVGSVAVDGRAFVAGASVSLADGDSDGTYTARLTVDFDAAASDGDRSVPVTATDAVGNGRTVQTGTLTLDTPPTVSNFSVAVGSGSTLDISFDASEALTDVNVTLSGATNATLDETDFTATGTTYERSHAVSENGSVTVTLKRLADANGNDGASGQSATVSLNGSAAESDGGGGGGGGGRRVVVVEPDPDDEGDGENDSAPPAANVSVERTEGNGASARVDAARRSSLVDLPVNATSDSADVSLDTLSIASRNESYTVDVRVHDAPNGTDWPAGAGMRGQNATNASGAANASGAPNAPGTSNAANATAASDDAGATVLGNPVVGYFSVDHTVADRDIDYAVFRFAVSERRLSARNVSPDEVSLYRYHGGEWTELNAIPVGKRGDSYVYNADTPGLSTFAVGRESGGRVAVTGASVDRTRVRTGEEATVTVRVANDGTQAATGYVSLTVDGETAATRRVTLGAGDTGERTFTVRFADAGTHELAVGNLTAGTVEAVEPTPTPAPTETRTPAPTPTATRTATSTPTETGTGVPGFGPVAAVLSLLVVAGAARRRS